MRLPTASPQKRSRIITSQQSFLNSDISRFRHEVLLPWAMRRSSLTLCVSEGIRYMLLRQKIKPSKLRVLYNPVDREKILENSQKEIKDYGDFLVFVRRIYEVKNNPFLLKSFKIFLGSNPSSSCSSVMLPIWSVQGSAEKILE